MFKKNWAWIFLCIMLLVFFVFGLMRGVIFTTGNDFDWHCKFGRDSLRMAAGITNIPMTSHYLPGRAVFNAVLAFLTNEQAKCVFFVLSYSSFILALSAWGLLLYKAYEKRNKMHVILSLAASLVVLIFYFVRDFDDCGLQIFLLSLLIFAAWLLSKGYKISSGLMLALAVSWKTAPLLFLPFLIYKRQFKVSAALLIGIIFFNSVPPLILFGSTETSRQLRSAVKMFKMSVLPDSVTESEVPTHLLKYNTEDSFLVGLKDPRRNPVEMARNQNQALKPAIGRYLMHSAPGDPLYITCDGYWQSGGGIGDSLATNGAPPHPLWKQFLDLPVPLASKTATVLVLLLGLAIAWAMRKSWVVKRVAELDTVNDIYFLQEWSVAMIFIALLSPLCWLQHLVLIFPALTLILHEAFYYKNNWGLWRWCCLVFLVLPSWIFERDFIGKEWSIIALSYKFHTFAALLLVLLILKSKERTAGKK